jgi:hypothetical protein
MPTVPQLRWDTIKSYLTTGASGEMLGATQLSESLMWSRGCLPCKCNLSLQCDRSDAPPKTVLKDWLVHDHEGGTARI